MMNSSKARRPWVVAVWIAIALSAGAFAQQNESLVLDPGTGNYVVTYCCNADGSLAQAVLEPSTKVTPTAISRFAMQNSRYVKYEYEVYVLGTSEKALEAFRLDPVSSIKTDLPVPDRRADVSRSEWAAARASLTQHMDSPQGWQPAATLSNKAQGLRLSWRRPGLISPPAEPGTRHNGFGFESLDLPGIGVGQFTSPAGVWKFSNEGPDRSSPVGQQLAQLEENDFVPRFVAVPTIGISSAFNTVAVLEKIREHVKGWPQQQLMEQTLWERVDSLLSQAIAAAGAPIKTTTATKLAQVRSELRARYPEMDAATVSASNDPAPAPATDVKPIGNSDLVLAARVLDFDVAYVMERLGPKVSCTGVCP